MKHKYIRLVEIYLLYIKFLLLGVCDQWALMLTSVNTLMGDETGKHFCLIVTNLPDIDLVSCSPAIAGNGAVAGLGVQGEQLQVHPAAQGQGDLE